MCTVRRELRSLLDSLLRLQQNLLSRHTDTPSQLAMGSSTGIGEREEALSDDDDEEVPSDLGSDEEEDEREGGKEGAGVGEGESQNQTRQRRKRKCPWVR